jgi:hypothetical protein
MDPLRLVRVGVTLLCFVYSQKAFSHDIYTGVYGKDHQYCCFGDANGVAGDCAPALARVNGNNIEFNVRGKEWVSVPRDRVTFLPLPGEEDQVHDEAPEGMVWGHFCGRPRRDEDMSYNPNNVFGNWYFYCGFYPPGEF